MTTEILYTPFVNECGMEIETDQFNLDEFGESIEDDHELICKICSKELKSPKVLSCLHAFCKCCLENVAEKTSINNETIVTLKCPKCKQDTIIHIGQVDSMLTDLVAEDLLRPETEKTVIICTSCKARKEAIAQCEKCPNFLCFDCTTAHQCMRCFEEHEVIMFEDILNSCGSIDFVKPVFCSQHVKESLTHFCKMCMVTVCMRCMEENHAQPDHVCVKISGVQVQFKEDLKTIVSHSRMKLGKSQEDSQAVGTALSELQEQYDNAKGLISETFQSYKSILEAHRDKVMDELDEIHAKQELQLMESIHMIGNNEAKLEDACCFADKMIEHKNSTYAVIFYKLIYSQLIRLHDCSPKVDTDVNIKFNTDGNTFEAAIKQIFGSFSKSSIKPCSDMSLVMNPSFAKPNVFDFSNVNATGILDLDVAMHLAKTQFLPGLNGANSTASLASLTNVNPIVLNGNLENLTNLASSMTNATAILGVDPSSRTSLSPDMSDSGISVDAASTNSNNSATLINIAAMAKMGLSRQAILGSTFSNVTNSSPTNVLPIASSINRMNTPLPLSIDGLCSGFGMPPPQVQHGNLEMLANMIGNRPPPTPSTSHLETSNCNLNFNLDHLAIAGIDITGTSAVGGSMSNLTLGNPSGNVFNGDNCDGASYPPVRRANKMSAMQIRNKFGQLGPGKSQFNSPHGFCLGTDQDIIVADTNNHRIQIFEKSGEFKTQFGIPGREEGQLWYPRKVAVMRNGKFVVCDRGSERSRMQIFSRCGIFAKKVAIRYIDIVAGLAITNTCNIVAVDSVSPTVFVITEAGDLVKWFDCSDYMREPSDIAVRDDEYFVCDFKGHCVVVFNEDGSFLRRIGCENITNYPNGIDVSDAGDVLVGDSHGNRFHVAVFQRDGSLVGEFQCPYVKVSRCCGLKITSEGYIITLAKNNHHVLILNTLYIV